MASTESFHNEAIIFCFYIHEIVPFCVYNSTLEKLERAIKHGQSSKNKQHLAETAERTQNKIKDSKNDQNDEQHGPHQKQKRE